MVPVIRLARAPTGSIRRIIVAKPLTDCDARHEIGVTAFVS
jgi:hypothetical protein